MSLLNALKKSLIIAKELGITPVVIGGLAAAYWGSKRRTVDVDFQIALQRSALTDLLGVARKYGFVFKEPIMTGLRFSYDGTDVDFLITSSNLENEVIKTAVPCKILGVSTHCANINELIAMKWLAERLRDIKDINNIILNNSGKVDRQRINALVPEKPFHLEPDGSPKQLKKASIGELTALSTKEKNLITKINKIITLIEKM